MIWSALQLSLKEIRRNLLRSFLTILGVVIGVGAVITMVTLGNGATRAIADQIEGLGSNMLILRPGQRLGPGRDAAGAPPFDPADARAITDQIGSLDAVAPSVTRSLTVVRLANNWSTTIVGSPPAYFRARNLQLAQGRLYTDAEERAGRAVCVIGETVRRELFGRENPIGGAIRIRGFSCDVIGLLVAKGQAAMGMDQDDVILMPMHTVQRRLLGSRDVESIVLAVSRGASIDRAKAAVERLMHQRRHIAAGENDDFTVLDTRQIADALSSTTRVMTVLLSAVAAVSLLVGGIGIMNIMLVSVTERTREIGIRLAIGALEHEVLLQFLIEAVVLSALGGLLGIVLAAIGSAWAASAMHLPFLFDVQINVLAFVFSAAIGIVFGYFPARRAARRDPIDALRHE
ncbi:MAG: multidrug ABC transporter substrate-binding protein [Rhodanobacteraceae bacterium]